MTRLYGRAPRSSPRRRSVHPGLRRGRLFVAVALRRDGLGSPMVLDGPMTGQAFLAYVEQVVIPTLKPNDIVALAGGVGTRRLIGATVMEGKGPHGKI